MFSPESVTVKIPVKAHVKAYLEKNLFLTQPYYLSSTDPFGMVILEFLETKKKTETAVRVNHEYTIDVMLGFNTALNYKMVITGDKVKRFNLFVERMIMHEMCKYLDWTREHRVMKIRPGIINFQDRYGFDEGQMSYDRLKKAYYRYRIQRKRRIKTAA